jgi:CHRD domain
VTRVLGALAVVVAAVLALASCHGTEPQFTIGGNVSGNTVSVVLLLNGGNGVSVNSGGGSFKFDKKLLKDDTFNVQVVDSNDQCNVANGAGTVSTSNINDVSITCVAQASQSPQLTIIRMANLDGSQENPPVTTNASGVGGIVVIPSTTQPMPITGGITFSGLAPTQLNIHQAPTGNPTGNGLAIIPLTLASDGLTAVVPPGTTLPAALIGPLLRGELYFNVATAANPNGEIRGAIQLQGGVAASLTGLDQSQVIPPTGSAATGLGTLLADRATGRVLISYVTHTVTGTTTASLSTSSGAGAVIVAFPNQRSNIDGAGTNLANPASTAVLSAQSISDFDNSLLYFNVTSAGFPNGEIRGNISPLPQ